MPAASALGIPVMAPSYMGIIARYSAANVAVASCVLSSISASTTKMRETIQTSMAGSPPESIWRLMARMTLTDVDLCPVVSDSHV